MRGRFRNSFLNQSLCGKSENSGKYQTARCDAYVQEGHKIQIKSKYLVSFD
jgi:hypothetical protein